MTLAAALGPAPPDLVLSCLRPAFGTFAEVGKQYLSAECSLDESLFEEVDPTCPGVMQDRDVDRRGRMTGQGWKTTRYPFLT
jgi:hypothetical protein